MSAEKIVTLDPDSVCLIREMLLVGLLSLGEVERVLNNIEVATGAGIGDIPANVVPRHPTDDAGTVSNFANALRLLAA